MQITQKTKDSAIALFRLGDTPEQVAEAIELPLPLVREWYDTLDKNEVVAIQAATTALERMVHNGDVSNLNKEMFEANLLEAAQKIVSKIAIASHNADVMESKALSLLAQTCKDLYFTFVAPGKTTADNPNGVTVNLLTAIGRKD